MARRWPGWLLPRVAESAEKKMGRKGRLREKAARLLRPTRSAAPSMLARENYPSRGSCRDGLFEPAIHGRRGAPLEGDLPQTSSFLAPIKVRSRSAKRAASNGFLKVSLMLERSKLVEPPSSGSKAIRITSAKALLRRRF